MNALLTVAGLGKTYAGPRGSRIDAVRNVSFELQRSEILAVVGESGSGKTTVGRMITGLEEKSAGSVTLGDEILPARYRRADFARLGRRIQMVFQDPLGSLNPFFSTADILREALGFTAQRPADEKATRAAILALLEQVGLSAQHADRLPHQLSGGQRQRLGIARALAMQPDIIVCDEPVSALDVSVQAQILQLLQRLRDERGLSLLFITHNLNVVRQIADRVLVMKKGEVVELAAVQTLFDAPQHDYTKMLLDACPVPELR
jgi:ABC-type glutathione transport system ATPase component